MSEPLDPRFTEAEEELHRHHDRVMGARTLSEVDDEANRYQADMSQIIADMDDSMHMRSQCSEAGMSEMRDRMSGLMSEMVEHWSTLEGAVDIPSVRAACASHVTAMHEMFSSIHEALDRTGCRMMGH